MAMRGALCVFLLTPLGAWQQSAQSAPDAPTPQQSTPGNLPDAPKAQPDAGPLPVPAGGLKPSTSEPPAATNEQSTPATQDENQSGQNGSPAPLMPPVRTVPAGGAPRYDANDTGRDSFVLHVQTNLVVVPVSVKDQDGRLVEGLQKKDFAVFEDGVQQNLSLFTSDPFPLSAAVIIDQGMSDTALRRVNETLPAIAGAFSQYDEVAVYTYGDSVSQASDFIAAGDQLLAALRKSKRHGSSGAMMNAGPLAAGPSYNGHPMDPSQPNIQYYRRPSRVLNDAVLRAAEDLARRDKARRKVIFIISDGEESGSFASYSEVLKVLLTNEIQVYGVGVDSAAIPVYSRLTAQNLPGSGHGNVLPKYVSATGGDYLAELRRSEIEKAYARATEEARNQYTLGYQTRATAASNYRSIEVRVHRPGLRVYAKDGYYPLPPQHSGTTAAPK